MSSTYSTNLAIELIGAGEQAGTWGTTTNTNLGTLIEQAISGYTTTAMSTNADTTITIPQGATGEARNMYIEIPSTLTLTAARILTVPANKKLYFVYNGSTGGYAVTVKVSGQTGVSVPNGAKMILVCNGTDIVSATNYQASLTLGAALPVLSGGTGVTTSTGSGNNVLSTSPILVTPNLGTPSALVGTNITGTAAGLSIGGSAASATNATSAGFATNATFASSATNATSAGFATNATFASSATNASAATNATSAGYATSAGSAGSATNATSATYATSAGSATNAGAATNATSATYATSAGSATNAGAATNATSAGYATSAGSAGSATNATSATYAGTAGAVAWGNVSSKPSLVYNDGGTYSVNIYGGAGSATNATYAGSAGSASNATYAGSAGSASSATNASYASTAGSLNDNSSGGIGTYTIAGSTDLYGADCSYPAGNTTVGGSTLVAFTGVSASASYATELSGLAVYQQATQYARNDVGVSGYGFGGTWRLMTYIGAGSGAGWSGSGGQYLRGLFLRIA